MKSLSHSNYIFIFFVYLLIISCQNKSTDAKKEQVKPTKNTLSEKIMEVREEPIAKTIEAIEYDYDTSKWTDVGLIDTSIVMDLKYASTDNFVETKMYDCARCFLRPEVAKAVLAIHKKLQADSLGLKMFDCYRPRPIQWKLWEKVPDPRYVADPKKGSMHNRGGAVDLTIVDANGEELDMGTDFDFFGPEAYQAYAKHPKEVLDNRKLLRETMLDFGFNPIRTEWWHYSFASKSYELSDMLWNCRD
ncbi:MAG: M15 family metallopeptidase [Bacteroidota bacterium]